MQEHLSHRFKPANLLSGFRRACEVAPDRFETFRPRAAWWRLTSPTSTPQRYAASRAARRQTGIRQPQGGKAHRVGTLKG